MNNYVWDEIELDSSEEQQAFDKNNRDTGHNRKRKWREIEDIKEKRRLKRDLADFKRDVFNV